LSEATAAWAAALAEATAPMGMLDRYVGATALKTYAVVAAGLTAMFTLLDFVEQLALVGQGHYLFGDALAYVVLTAPGRLLQVTPVSMLLGSLLALGNLNRRTELTALRCLGISEVRIIASVMKAAVPVCLILLVMSEFLIPKVERLAQDQRSLAIESAHSEDSFWAYGNGQYLNVQRFRHDKVLEDVDIFSFSTGGELTGYLHSDHADLQPNGSWLLRNVLKKTITAALFKTEHLDSVAWQPFISASQLQLLRLPLESMPPVELFRYIRSLRREHQPVSRYEQELWAKIGIPISIIAMIMIAAPFVFGTSRARDLGYQIVVGAAIGIVFSLGQQITRHVGVLLDLSPAVTALGPSLLLTALAVYLFRRSV
jgi:lipopolysaccharide export system permease protein